MKTLTTLFNLTKGIMLLTLLAGSFLFSSCNKNIGNDSGEKPDSNQQSRNAGLGLRRASPSDYASIPVASVPPGGIVTLPGSYSLAIPLVPFNQGQQGSCSSCAVAMAKSILDHVKLNIPYLNSGIIYSPSYLYSQSMAFPGSCDLGSQIKKNLDVLKEQGVCRLTDMPYSDDNCSVMPTAMQNNLAASHKIDHYFRLDPINTTTIKQFINAGLPVLVGFKVDNIFKDQYWDTSNNNKVWTKFGTYVNNDHTTLLSGWDDSRNAFRMLNQWGNLWGDNGSIWVDYNLVENNNVFLEAYIIQNPAVNNNSTLEISGALVFGDVTINTSVSKKIQLKNTGTANITISSIVVNSPFSSDWSSGLIQPGKTVDLSITFNPTSLGVVDKPLTINYDTANSPITIQATGNAIQAAIQTRIISLSGNISFGNVNVGQNASKSFIITNSGNNQLTVSSVSVPQGYSCSFNGIIQAGGSTTVSVVFTPSNVQTYNGNLVVNSDATSGTNSIVVSGSGIQQVADTRIISLSGALSFGLVNLGETATKTTSILNSGNNLLTISSVSVPQGFSCNYRGTIQPGGSAIISVVFTPSNIQTYNGNMVVNSDATSGSNSTPVSGSGIRQVSGTLEVIPALGTMGNCAPEGTNPFYPTFMDGIVNAKIVKIDKTTKEIIFEIYKCNGAPYNYDGNAYVVNTLAGGPSLGGVQFYRGWSSITLKIIEPDMTGTKTYYPYIFQLVSQIGHFYDAPKIVVQY